MKLGAETNIFIEFVRTQPGATWHVRQIHDPSAPDGARWLIEWHVNDRSLKLAPAAARQLARYLRDLYRVGFAKIGGKKLDAEGVRPNDLFAWLDTFDAKAKEALHFNRDGVLPPRSEAA